MKVVTRDVPTPKKGEMLIKVAAAAINRPDVIQVRRSRLSLMVRDRECTLLPRVLPIFPAWSALERSWR